MQLERKDHHYVIVYPENEGGDGVPENVRSFDPWPAQTATVYTYDEYSSLPGLLPWRPDTSSDPDFPGTCYQECRSPAGVQVVPPPYPTAGGRCPYFPQNENRSAFRGSSPWAVDQYDGCFQVPPRWCATNGVEGLDVINGWNSREPSGRLYIGSPVVFKLHVTGRRAFEGILEIIRRPKTVAASVSVVEVKSTSPRTSVAPWRAPTARPYPAVAARTKLAKLPLASKPQRKATAVAAAWPQTMEAPCHSSCY